MLFFWELLKTQKVQTKFEVTKNLQLLFVFGSFFFKFLFKTRKLRSMPTKPKMPLKKRHFQLRLLLRLLIHHKQCIYFLKKIENISKLKTGIASFKKTQNKKYLRIPNNVITMSKSVIQPHMLFSQSIMETNIGCGGSIKC